MFYIIHIISDLQWNFYLCV